MFKVRRVCWRNKAEWLQVYEKAFDSGNIDVIREALKRMEVWIKTGNCPPAIEFTHSFMMIMISDPHFFPGLSDQASEKHLQTQYATSLLRFVNILGDVETGKTMSLSAKALKAGLPEWVVNVRHQVSHGTNLPSLSILRLSIKSLLDYLQENYWEVEKKFMNDLVLPDRVKTLEEKFTKLLKIYVFLKRSCNNVEMVRDIEDDEMKQAILALDNLQYYTFKQETSPWELNELPGSNLLKQPKKLQKYKIPNITTLIVSSIKMYYDHESPAILSKHFAAVMLSESYETGHSIERWEQLIFMLHGRCLLAPLIYEFIERFAHKGLPTTKDAARWAVVLIRSFHKRLVVERKLLNLSANSNPSFKRMRLDMNERERHAFSMEGIKRQLGGGDSSTDGLKVEVLPSLFRAAEKSNCFLKYAFRLPEPKFMTEHEIWGLMCKIFEKPCEYSEALGSILLEVSNSITAETVANLVELAKLKEAPSKMDRFGRCPTYNSSILASRLGMPSASTSKI